MYALIGALLFFIIAVVTILVALGFPLGEFIMGGKHRVLPKNLRIVSFIFAFVQAFAIIIILQAGGYIELWFSALTTRNICMFYAAYLTLNILMNLLSKSKKERYVMTPISAMLAICYWIVPLNMIV